jgi:phosphate transport system protein
MPRTKLEEETEELNSEIATLSETIENLIDQVILSFEKIDVEKLQSIKDTDIMIYLKTKSIETKCVDLLALQSPVAGDLRKIFTILETLTDLDRIGRYAYDISLEIPYFMELGHIKKLEKIPAMAQLTKSMVKLSITSFLNKDLELARSLINEDDKVDDLYKLLIRETIEHMKADLNNISRGIHYVLVGRYLERMADHAVNIGDRVVYMLTGEKIIHLKNE